MQFASYANRRLGRWGGASVRRLTNHYLDLVGRASLAGLRVCEIGPGRGNFAEACRAADAIYLGVECCPDFVRQLRERRFAVIETEVPPIPRHGHPYDLIFAGGMIEHPAPERIAPFLGSALDALRAGGGLDE
jgi:cyclopropane fatty-acyl-phospholipid synthase-like methyltransferase